MRRLFLLLIGIFQIVSAQDTLYLGMKNRYADKREMLAAFAPAIKTLNESSKMKWKLKVYESSEQVLEALVSGKVQVAKVSPLSFATKRRSFALKAVALSLNKQGKSFYYSSIVVYKKSPLQTVDQLKGVKFAFGSKYSASSFLVPALMLKKNNISLSDIDFHFLHKQPAILLNLMKGKYEAGAVITDLLGKTRPGTFREIIKSDPIPSSPLIVVVTQPTPVTKEIIRTFKNFSMKVLENNELANQLDGDFKYGFSFDVDARLFDPLEKSFREIIPMVQQ